MKNLSYYHCLVKPNIRRQIGQIVNRLIGQIVHRLIRISQTVGEPKKICFSKK